MTLKLSVATWNANGLNSKLYKVLSRARSQGIDILATQEHNVHAGKLRLVKRAAALYGFEAYVSPIADTATKGGACTVVRS